MAKNNEELNSNRGLEIVLAILIIPMLVISLLFLSGNITGNAIADLSNDTTFSIGGVLFLLGLVLTFFYFRIRN